MDEASAIDLGSGKCLAAGYRANVAWVRSFFCGHLSRDKPIFLPNPFHADKISLKRGLMNRPGPGQEWF
jgi:hypothetical protein